MAVHVNKRLCKGCGLCISVCPKNVYEISNETNQKGFTVVAAVREGDCIKCKRCEITCPDMALWIEE
ncbi:MAG TPA: 4Fe-4S binding protein [Synergistales bacterium]|jgi:2-oxoglutarate ferredoxin oxidoreductase subunit delta|nr:4Fe-4S binding protein [Synergistaceae bacterium]NLD97727.1 4Fe-4S binding protein [Synergistaceae bacterium]HOO87146.1 4Fe-4S binding protein [Synergistales bacterium]HPE66485.1 4Fe-4S binding protein [Synergistales bacterium]HRV98137.1 4Fe-4S binding protein [Aminobacteriaceae bacterium]